MTETEKNDYLLANWRTVPKKTICKELKIGHNTLEKMWHRLHQQGLVPLKREMDKQFADHMKPEKSDEEIRAFILANNHTTPKGKMIAALKCSAVRFRRIYKALADAGQITPRLHGGLFNPDQPKAKPKPKPKVNLYGFHEVIVSPWVPEQYVNKSCRWLAA
jgi:hypothetical protein